MIGKNLLIWRVSKNSGEVGMEYTGFKRYDAFAEKKVILVFGNKGSVQYRFQIKGNLTPYELLRSKVKLQEHFVSPCFT